ncbi:hypothetical protein [Brevibacillus fulvus]|uniref:Uncharacterized protein n=1 Tax=Brevibacillus fulvus TaxID=1125967 RepID=A0A938Y4G7_9BACL|nr:hypothetical protein [Brevibacillus fulvus]MBM7591432.1 hypothetical protein [Brevibacillus fulvus]
MKFQAIIATTTIVASLGFAGSANALTHDSKDDVHVYKSPSLFSVWQSPVLNYPTTDVQSASFNTVSENRLSWVFIPENPVNDHRP